MVTLEKKSLAKHNSLPSSVVDRLRPKLGQTRRHSWFGAGRDLSFESIYKNHSEMDEILEEEEEEGQIHADGFNTSMRQRISNAIVRSKINRTKGKTDSAPKAYVGLERKERNSSTTKSTASPRTSSAKRRSGFGNWLAGSDSSSKDSVFDTEATDSLKPLPGVRQSLASAGDSRAFGRRATVHYSSTGRPSLMHIKRQAYALRPNEMRALEQLKDVCRDFIAYRLRQRNLANRVILDRQRSKERWLYRELVFIYGELERMQNCRFYDISKQIGITLRSEEVLRKVFFEISSEIVTTDLHQERLKGSEHRNSATAKSLMSFGSRMTEITWGRICAVLAVAGGLAVDCVQQGHADLVNYIIDYVGDFAREEDILPWIVNQGGWESLRDLTYDPSAGNPASSSWFFHRAATIVVAFAACSFSAVLAAFTIGRFAKTEN